MNDLKKFIVANKFDWLHDGKNKTGECVFKEDGTMFAFNGDGNWKVTDSKTLWAKFRGFENTLRFTENKKEAVLTWPARDPPSLMRVID